MTRDPLKEPKFGDVFRWRTALTSQPPPVMFLRWVTDRDIEEGVLGPNAMPGSWVGISLGHAFTPKPSWGWYPFGHVTPEGFRWEVAP